MKLRLGLRHLRVRAHDVDQEGGRLFPLRKSPTRTFTSAGASSFAWPEARLRAWRRRARWARAGGPRWTPRRRPARPRQSAQAPIQNIARKMVTTTDPPNSFDQITSYNNFYEFGTNKSDPKRYAGKLTTSPWTVKIDGLCNKPADYHLEDLIKTSELEERVYRHRCVEAWSMVIPWVGIPLASILNRVEPTAKATFVEFTTLLRPTQMPGLPTAA